MPHAPKASVLAIQVGVSNHCELRLEVVQSLQSWFQDSSTQQISFGKTGVKSGVSLKSTKNVQRLVRTRKRSPSRLLKRQSVCPGETHLDLPRHQNLWFGAAV